LAGTKDWQEQRADGDESSRWCINLSEVVKCLQVDGNICTPHCILGVCNGTEYSVGLLARGNLSAPHSTRATCRNRVWACVVEKREATKKEAFLKSVWRGSRRRNFTDSHNHAGKPLSSTSSHSESTMKGTVLSE
jgi:hypothetical protein